MFMNAYAAVQLIHLRGEWILDAIDKSQSQLLTHRHYSRQIRYLRCNVYLCVSKPIALQTYFVWLLELARTCIANARSLATIDDKEFVDAHLKTIAIQMCARPIGSILTCLKRHHKPNQYKWPSAILGPLQPCGCAFALSQRHKNLPTCNTRYRDLWIHKALTQHRNHAEQHTVHSSMKIERAICGFTVRRTTTAI